MRSRRAPGEARPRIELAEAERIGAEAVAAARGGELAEPAVEERFSVRALAHREEVGETIRQRRRVERRVRATGLPLDRAIVVAQRAAVVLRREKGEVMLGIEDQRVDFAPVKFATSAAAVSTAFLTHAKRRSV